MRMPFLTIAVLAALCALAGCASMSEAPVDVKGADVASHDLGNVYRL